MHTQNLRDNEHSHARYFSHWRGWLKRWKWEYCIGKDIFQDLARFEVTLGGEDPAQVKLSVSLLGAHLYLTFYKILPKRWEIGWFQRGEEKNPRWFDESHGRCWGFYWNKEAFSLDWGHTVTSSGRDPSKYGYHWYFRMPWEYECVRWEVQTSEGTWNMINHKQAGKAWRTARKKDPAVDRWRFKDEDYPDHRKYFVTPYTYGLKRGTPQEVTATYYVTEMEWRWKLFYRLPFRFGPKKVSRSIDISFSKGIGEEAGSWKGGCTGCSYELKSGESPIDCLRRMERERKF